MPTVTVAPHLQQYALELGLCKSAGMGIAAVDWVDIQAWTALTGTDLHPEEARIIRAASQAYVHWVHKSKQMDCPAPDS